MQTDPYVAPTVGFRGRPMQRRRVPMFHVIYERRQTAAAKADLT